MPQTDSLPSAETSVAALRRIVHGLVLTPGDCGYGDAQRLFNAAHAHRPRAIVQVTGAADVAGVLDWAARSRLTVSVRGGGHGVAGRALAGDVVLDLTALRGVVVDPHARTAVVRGGTTWGEVDAATSAHGLAVPGARSPSCGVGGTTLGGGNGWLSRRHGRTADNLLAVELVTADGRRVFVSSDCEPDLFGALGLAGANFGVATSLTFRLHDIAALVLGGVQLFPLSAAPEVVKLLDDLHGRGRTEFAGTAMMRTAPAASYVPGDLVGRPVLAVIPAWLGDPEDGRRFAAGLTAARPLVDTTGPTTYAALQRVLEDAWPVGQRQAWTASSTAELPSELVTDLADAVISAPSRASHISFLRTGRVEDDNQPWLVHGVAQWGRAANDRTNRAWLGGVHDVLAPSEQGTVLNADAADPVRVRWALGEARFHELQRLKAVWDPHDVFRHCDHVVPTLEGASS